MIFLDLIFGALLLLAGRKLFWLAVGIIGFVAGFNLAGQIITQGDSLTIIALALLFGILGAILAVAFEWLAVIFVVGFLGGGYLLANSLPVAPEANWVLFIFGGGIGMIVVILAFDWALIAISSLLGATLIVQHLHASDSARLTIFICSALIGVVLQYLSTREEAEEETKED